MQPSFLQRVVGGDTQIKKDEEDQFSRYQKALGASEKSKAPFLAFGAYFFSSPI